MDGAFDGGEFSWLDEGEAWPTALPDLFAELPDAPNSGAALLRDALGLLDRGELQGAADLIEQAQARGLPAELIPHAAVARGAALLQLGRGGDAATLLEEAWRRFPDVAAIAALLGAAWFTTERPVDAARAFFAALAGDDPDRTLERYRPLIGALARTVLT